MGYVVSIHEKLNGKNGIMDWNGSKSQGNERNALDEGKESKSREKVKRIVRLTDW